MTNGEMWLRQALLLLAARRFDEAIAKAEQALTTEMDDEWMEERGQQFPRSNRSKAYYVIGTAHCEQGDSARAIEALDQALRLIADDHPSLSNRAISKRNAGDEVGALADFTRALAHKPQYAHARANRARLYAKRGELEHADDDYVLLLHIANTPENRAEWNAVREQRGLPNDDAALAAASEALRRG